MQHLDVKTVLERAKTVLGLNTDIELAEFFRVPRSTIASWRRRESIPVRYLAEFVAADISLDWLLTGQGTSEKLGDFGFSTRKTNQLDETILWISLIVAIQDIIERDERNGEKVNAICNASKSELFDFAVYFSRAFQNVANSKQAWEKSALLKDGKIYEALVQEYQLSDTKYANPPWWEDEELI
ncbi:MAG: helix-turn-helix domain containing protein [Sneathiella sp.]|nr:helix-turn-helix domain containing protein [Sneathiella sp.]